MKSERPDLLRDVLDAGQQRDAVLLAGGKILRRKRHIRFATRSLAVAAGIVLAVVMVRQHRLPPPAAPVVAQAPASKVRHLTDDELLALFPGTPVALGTVNGKTFLIFPRPGDEARFVARPAQSTRL